MATKKENQTTAADSIAERARPLSQCFPVLIGEATLNSQRTTLDHEAALVRDLLVQHYREFGSEEFEEYANELVDCVRRIYARLVAPVESDINLELVSYDTKTIDEAP
ncbi:hypothetical protein QUQ16_001119 [Escherichia coli]|nr:hypothetical protein [Escherichia coli]